MLLGVLASGLRTAAVRFAAAQTGSVTRVRSIVRHHGALLEVRVKAHAPRGATSEYARSIHREERPLAAGWAVEVGTDEPQGWRLEFGFHGVDAAGRTYSQAPQPHFGPAVSEVEPSFRWAMRSIRL